MPSIKTLGLAIISLTASTVLADDEWAGCYKHEKSCGYLGAGRCPEPKLQDSFINDGVDWAINETCEKLVYWSNSQPDDTDTEHTICVRSTASHYHNLFTLHRQKFEGSDTDKNTCVDRMKKIAQDCESGAGGEISAGDYRYRVDPNTGYCPKGLETMHPPPGKYVDN